VRNLLFTMQFEEDTFFS